MSRHFLHLLVFFSPALLPAQNYFEVDTSRHCLYHGNELPGEFYTYPVEADTFELIKDEILYKTKTPENFVLHWSNVETVAAMLDRDQRYVLYSRKFLLPLLRNKEDRVLAFALLAHAIGHHANEHTLLPGNLSAEETEADEFMGYALALLGFSEAEVQSVPGRLSLRSGLPEQERTEAVLNGYHRADASLRNGLHASYFEENANEVIRNFPKFDLPPPKWSADADLDHFFKSCKTLYDAERLLRKALDASGYYSRKYYRTEGGFAMVTRLEQFNQDGSCKNEKDRWQLKPVSSESFSIGNYLYSLFVPQPGYFRVIVFVVTPVTFSAGSAKSIGREEATAWLNEGRNRLPDAIGNQPFNPGKTSVNALIYEFMAYESDKKLRFQQQSSLQGMTHLQMAQVLSNLH